MIRDPARARAELLADTKEAVGWWAGSLRGWRVSTLWFIAFMALDLFRADTRGIPGAWEAIAASWLAFAVAALATAGLAAAHLRGPWREAPPGWTRNRKLLAGILGWGALWTYSLYRGLDRREWAPYVFVVTFASVALAFERSWRWALGAAVLLGLTGWLWWLALR